MKKSKFTVIDALIVIVIIAAAGIGIMKLRSGQSGGQKGEVEFTVLVSNVDKGTGDIVNIGDEVSISFSETAYAQITGVEEEEYIKSEFNSNLGKYVSHSVEGKSELKISAKCEASISDTSILNGKVPIRVGNEMPIRGKGYTLKGYVIEVEDR